MGVAFFIALLYTQNVSYPHSVRLSRITDGKVRSEAELTGKF